MRFIASLFIFFTFLACTNETGNEETSPIIFGHYFGECVGESCVEIFNLDHNILFEDVLDRYPSTEGNQFEWVERTDVSVEEIRDSLLPIPVELLGETEKIIGMPDAGDWGGIYVQVNLDGNTQFWLIDHKEDNIPVYLHAFTRSIKNTIQKLQ